MSFDLGVWYPQKRSATRGEGLYARLGDSDISGVVPLPAVDEFYAESAAKYPEINTIQRKKSTITTTPLGVAGWTP